MSRTPQPVSGLIPCLFAPGDRIEISDVDGQGSVIDVYCATITSIALEFDVLVYWFRPDRSPFISKRRISELEQVAEHTDAPMNISIAWGNGKDGSQVRVIEYPDGRQAALWRSSVDEDWSNTVWLDGHTDRKDHS